MKTVFVEIITPLGTFISQKETMDENELINLQQFVSSVSEGKYTSFSFTDNKGNKKYFSEQVLSNSILTVVTI